jgi:Ca-activated chloride channel homolog
MRTICWLGMLLFLLTACGNLQISVDQPASPAAEASATAAAPPAPDATPPAPTTPEIVVTPTATPRPEIRPTSPPETSASGDWQTAYDALVARYGKDYSQCETSATTGGACAKPETSLGVDELKEQINIQLILDSSGSMAEQIGGETKLTIAQRVMSAFVTTIPAEANVALRVYGHVGSNQEQDRPESCAGTELFYDFQPLDQQTFATAINAFTPTGWTPIAASLQAAQQDFAQYDGATHSNFIYLVSDGIETCDGDPVAAARDLHESNIQAIVNIIGFDVDAEAARQLREVAEAGGGEYFEARSAQELQEIFVERIDWKAWNAYWGCAIRSANRDWGALVKAANEEWSCTVDAANEEWNAIIREVRAHNNTTYRGIGNDIIRAATAKRNTIVDESTTARNQIVEQARAARDQAVDQADQERDDALQGRPTPTP